MTPSVQTASGDRPTILIVSLAGIRYATRPRKAARMLAATHDVRYLALQSSGRGGRVDTAGVFDSDGIAVHQVAVRPRVPGGGVSAKLRNLLLSYLPAFARLWMVALRTPATTIYIANPVLALIALAHRWRFRSRIVVDIAERPGAVAARDSLASVMSRFEPFVLRLLGRQGSVATVAVPSDVATLREAGFSHVVPLRNAPLRSWRAPYVPPAASDELRCVVIGSVFPGRAYEILIRAVGVCAERGSNVRLRLIGPGTPEYLAELRELSVKVGAAERISWESAIEPDAVSAAYLESHLGLVLYEPDDPGNDGLSNKILECVSSGRPVLAGDLPENRAFVLENRVGWLTDVSADAIADRLMSIQRGPGLSEISLRCRALGDSALHWEAEFGGVLDLLATT